MRLFLVCVFYARKQTNKKRLNTLDSDLKTQYKLTYLLLRKENAGMNL